MSEYQAQVDSDRTLDELRRRITDLENTIAQWQINGAEDMFSVAGGQIYGGGVMRIDNEGLQILTEGAERPALWFFDDRFSNNPSSKYPQSRIQGTVIDGTSSSMGISSLFGLGASDERATWVVQASSTGNGRARSYPAQGFLGLGDGWEDVQISSGVVALNQGYSLLAIDPETGSSDSLEEITGPHGAGDLLVIRASGSGDSITVVNGANKIETSDGNNVTISGQTQAMGFISLGTGGWREIFRPAGGAASWTAGSELTIASGVVSAPIGSATFYRIDTESNAASDNLDTISAATGHSLAAGQLIHIHPADDARTVVVTESGNIRLGYDSTYSMSDLDRNITLIYDGTNWREVCRSYHNF